MILIIAFGLIAGFSLGLWARVGAFLAGALLFSSALTLLLAFVDHWTAMASVAGFAASIIAMQIGYFGSLSMRFARSRIAVPVRRANPDRARSRQ